MAAGSKSRRFRRPSPMTLREWLAGYAFASPFLIGFLVFTAFPMVYSIWLSFHSWDMISTPRFIGLDNFAKLQATNADACVARRSWAGACAPLQVHDWPGPDVSDNVCISSHYRTNRDRFGPVGPWQLP